MRSRTYNTFVNPGYNRLRGPVFVRLDCTWSSRIRQDEDESDGFQI